MYCWCVLITSSYELSTVVDPAPSICLAFPRAAATGRCSCPVGMLACRAVGAWRVLVVLYQYCDFLSSECCTWVAQGILTPWLWWAKSVLREAPVLFDLTCCAITVSCGHCGGLVQYFHRREYSRGRFCDPTPSAWYHCLHPSFAGKQRLALSCTLSYLLPSRPITVLPYYLLHANVLATLSRICLPRQRRVWRDCVISIRGGFACGMDSRAHSWSALPVTSP